MIDKNKKTTDEVLERKIQLINELETQLRNYYKSVDSFGTNA